jgi:hypothetical protein
VGALAQAHVLDPGGHFDGGGGAALVFAWQFRVRRSAACFLGRSGGVL